MAALRAVKRVVSEEAVRGGAEVETEMQVLATWAKTELAAEASTVAGMG